MEKGQEKRCFIVTPIGSDTDPIRRHIEGIMEAAIRPALGEKYELVVAHKIYEPGSITKQVISEIYNAELVIANLTNRNPNVMYELAFRHSLGKPVIMIAESGTSLPADIIMERTIFYQNDAQGVLELKKSLEKAESEIDFTKIGSPIHDVLHSIDRDINILQISKNEPQAGQEVLPYILEKLNKLEDMFLANKASKTLSSSPPMERVIQFALLYVPEDINERPNFVKKLSNAFRDPPYGILSMRLEESEENSATFLVYCRILEGFPDNLLKMIVEKTLIEEGYKIAEMPMVLKRIVY